MRPIRRGDRGPGVEDVQRRLAALGADLGLTGVDGVFLGATLAAVADFQRLRRLSEDGVVGPETWAALVDATFRLGDRLLYLRFPHFHGADVCVAQGALNALGFAAGDPDGVFGAFSERAVRDFQSNTGLPADGIVGPDTVRALDNLRHVWGDKAPDAPVALRRAPARSADILASRRVDVVALDERGAAVAARLQNLAIASEARARVTLTRHEDEASGLVLTVGGRRAVEGGEIPIVSCGDGGEALARRLEVALRSTPHGPESVRLLLDAGPDDEHSLQRIAVGLLDGLCLGLAGSDARGGSSPDWAGPSSRST